MSQYAEQDMSIRPVLLALGGNLDSPAGSPRETVVAAIDRIAQIFGEIAPSRLYATPAFPDGSGPDYVNAALRLTSDLPARDILTQLHKVEAEFARLRQLRWGARTLDVDLIAVGDEVWPDAPTHDAWRALSATQQQQQTPQELILPHPRLQDRAFVLVPLADVAAQWRHPILGQSVVEMLDALPVAARAEVRPIA